MRESPCGGEPVASPGLLEHEQLMEHPCRREIRYLNLSRMRQASVQQRAVVATGDYLHTEGLTNTVHILKLVGVGFLTLREGKGRKQGQILQ